MSEQKFKTGTRVQIDSDLGPSMFHFPKDQEAIVIATYAQQYGSHDNKSYTLLLLDEAGKPEGECSWYEEHQLTDTGAPLKQGQRMIFEYQFDSELEEDKE